MKDSLRLNEANLTVIGTGLMGGSILKALKDNKNRPRKITALDIDKDILKKIEYLSLADAATDDAELALKDADMVVMSLYPAQSIRFIKENVEFFKQGCVITDICGVKRELINTVPDLIPEGVSYVGGHPMAGTEHQGFDYSIGDLFVNCKYIIDEHEEKGKDLVIEFANTLGAGKIIEASADTHDELIAYTSQLPHVVAISYMLCAGERNVEEFSAGSFRDVTRVAMINDVMWSEIFCENKDMLVREVAEFRKRLKELEDYIDRGDVEGIREKMKKASKMREKIKEI